jgi:hypothetical protein
VAGFSVVAVFATFLSRLRLFAWVTIVLASACGGGGNDATCGAYRRFACDTSPTGFCDENGNPAEPLTIAELEFVRQHCAASGDGGV